MSNEATARIKINKLLEAAGWRFFAEDQDTTWPQLRSPGPNGISFARKAGNPDRLAVSRTCTHDPFRKIAIVVTAGHYHFFQNIHSYLQVQNVLYPAGRATRHVERLSSITEPLGHFFVFKRPRRFVARTFGLHNPHGLFRHTSLCLGHSSLCLLPPISVSTRLYQPIAGPGPFPLI